MFNSKNPLISPIVEDKPSSPIVNTRGIYPKSDGWYDIDSSGNGDKFVNLNELERLQYYGDKDIIPSSESYFVVNSTGETITGLTDTGKTQTELVIPDKINGVKITRIENYAFYRCSSMTSITIPNSVYDFGSSNVFASCKSLKTINIPTGVSEIGESAFSECTSLTSINLPDSIKYIYNNAFSGCTALVSIKIPDSVTSISFNAFSDCTSLTKIEILNSVTSIGPEAFKGCTSLAIYCEQGSYADTYAKDNGIPVVYTDVKDIGSDVEVVDNLTTDDSTKALSANQGKVLNDNKVDKVEGKSLIDEKVANSLSCPVSGGVKLGNNWRFDVGTMEHTLPTTGETDLEFVPNTGLQLITQNESGDFDITLIKGSKTHKLSQKASTLDVLTKTNITEFTPTANYHPATKKYVDDSISTSGGGDMLKTVYDTNNTGVVDNAEKLGGQLPSYYAKASTSVVVTLPNTVADWTTNTDENGEPYYAKSFSNEIFTSDGTPFVGVNYSDTISIARQQAEAYDSIDRVKVTDGSAIFYCFNDIPSVSLDIQIKMVY